MGNPNLSLVTATMSLMASILVSILVSLPLPLLKVLLIKNPSLSLRKNSKKLYTTKYRKDNTLAQFQVKMWKLLLALSSCPPSQSSQNQVEWVNNVIFRTTHFWSPFPSNSWIHLLIHWSIQTPSLQPGALFQSSLYLFTDFCQAPNWLQEMLQKHITQFHSTTPNGLLQLFAWSMIHLPLTLLCVLDQVHLQGHTAQFGMQLLTSCTPKASVQYLAGSMTTSSSESGAVFSQNTTGDKGNGKGTSHQGVSIMKAVGFGLEDEGLKMVHWNNSTRIAPEMHQVLLAVAKKEKYFKASQEWLDQPTHTLEDMEKLHGKLLHACLVIPMGRVYLSKLEHMLGIFHSSPLVPCSSPKGLQVDLKWWIIILWQPTIMRTIPWPVSLYDAQVFSDASSEFAITITVGNRWRAWWHIPGWQTLDGKRDIGWAEAITFKCLARHLANNGGQGRHFVMHGDNRGVIEGWWNGWSHSRVINGVFKRIHEITQRSTVESTFHTVYVGSKLNPADTPSQGIYPSTSLLLPPVQLPTELDCFIVDSESPFTPAKWWAHREGHYSKEGAEWFDNTHQRLNPCTQQHSRNLGQQPDDSHSHFPAKVWSAYTDEQSHTGWHTELTTQV